MPEIVPEKERKEIIKAEDIKEIKDHTIKEDIKDKAEGTKETEMDTKDKTEMDTRETIKVLSVTTVKSSVIWPEPVKILDKKESRKEDRRESAITVEDLDTWPENAVNNNKSNEF